jgi:hypothetical protein
MAATLILAAGAEAGLIQTRRHIRRLEESAAHPRR